MVKICPKCGNNNSDDAFWCINCNSKISNGLNIIQKKDNTISIVIVGFNQLNSDEEKSLTKEMVNRINDAVNKEFK